MYLLIEQTLSRIVIIIPYKVLNFLLVVGIVD